MPDYNSANRPKDLIQFYTKANAKSRGRIEWLQHGDTKTRATKNLERELAQKEAILAQIRAGKTLEARTAI